MRACSPVSCPSMGGPSKRSFSSLCAIILSRPSSVCNICKGASLEMLLLEIYSRTVRFKKLRLWHVESRQSNSRTLSFTNSRLRHVESRQSNSEPGDPEEMWSYRISVILSFSNVTLLSTEKCFNFLLATRVAVLIKRCFKEAHS